MSNEAPFFVGQKVVALKSSVFKDVIKGEVYTVAGMAVCDRCGAWHVIINETNAQFDHTHTTSCCNDDGVCWHSGLFHLAGNARFFAPIQHNYSDITAELCKQVQIGDSPDVPVKVIEVTN